MVCSDVIDAQRFRAGVGFMLTLALLGCGSQRVVTGEAALAPLSVAFQIDPTPAHVGSERITVTVRDKNRAPVTGATVTILPSYAAVPGGHAMRMSRMGQVTETLRAVDAGDGVYRAEVPLMKAAHWTFIVHVAAGRTQTTVTRDLEVK